MNNNNHKLSPTTTHKGARCNNCYRLFLGKFYQGYHCSQCDKYLHSHCIPKMKCREPSELRVNNQPILGNENAFHEYIVVKDVTGDENVLSLKKGEEVLIYYENNDGTFFGTKNGLTRISGSISKDSVRRLPRSCDEREYMKKLLNNEDVPEIRVEKPLSAFYSQRVMDYPKGISSLRFKQWYFEINDRNKAEELLDGKPDGTFIVRKNFTEDKYVISVYYGFKCEHLEINRREISENIEEYYLFEKRMFKSIIELIEYFRENSLVEGFSWINTTLTNTLLRTKFFSVECDHKHTLGENSKPVVIIKGEILTLVDTTKEDNDYWEFEAEGVIGSLPIKCVEPIV